MHYFLILAKFQQKGEKITLEFFPELMDISTTFSATFAYGYGKPKSKWATILAHKKEEIFPYSFVYSLLDHLFSFIGGYKYVQNH